MFEGGYGIGQLGHCKKCKAMTKSKNYDKLNGSLCKRCHEEEFGLQAQRDKKLEALFASKKKWWEFWKD